MARAALVSDTRKSGSRRGRSSTKDSPVQMMLGWAALALIFGTVLLAGGMPPLAWTGLVVGALGLFALQILLDMLYGLPARHAGLFCRGCFFSQRCSG